MHLTVLSSIIFFLIKKSVSRLWQKYRLLDATPFGVTVETKSVILSKAYGCAAHSQCEQQLVTVGERSCNGRIVEDRVCLFSL